MAGGSTYNPTCDGIYKAPEVGQGTTRRTLKIEYIGSWSYLWPLVYDTEVIKMKEIILDMLEKVAPIRQVEYKGKIWMLDADNNLWFITLENLQKQIDLENSGIFDHEDFWERY